MAGQPWRRALALRSMAGQVGYLIVGAAQDPPSSEQFLLRALAQQTGVALANARLHAKERATAEDLRAANTALSRTVRALKQTTASTTGSPASPRPVRGRTGSRAPFTS